MKTNTHFRLFTLITTCAAALFIATSSVADTPKATDENNTGQMMYPGMGPGHMGYGGMHHGYRGDGRMGPGYMHQGRMGYGGMGMMYALDLDKTQRSKLRSLMREQRTANCKTMNEMMDVRDQLAEEYDKPQPDAKIVGKLYEKMQGMQRHMLEQSIQMRNKVRAMLNKEQKETFDNMYHGGMGYGGMHMMGPGMMDHGDMWNMME